MINKTDYLALIAYIFMIALSSTVLFFDKSRKDSQEELSQCLRSLDNTIDQLEQTYSE